MYQATHSIQPPLPKQVLTSDRLTPPTRNHPIRGFYFRTFAQFAGLLSWLAPRVAFGFQSKFLLRSQSGKASFGGDSTRPYPRIPFEPLGYLCHFAEEA